MGNLSDRLKALGVQVGAQDIPRPKPRNAFSIEQVIPGQVQSTVYGETYHVDFLYPPDYRHGNTDLSLNASLKTLLEWGKANHLADSDPGGFLFLDTETTGLSGGTGTYAFLVGIGRFTSGGFQLIQYLMRDPTEEAAMLTALGGSIQACQALVTYNGKSFDAPLLNTRYTLHGFESPIPSLAHLDLLPLARRLWKDRLPSRSLGNIEFSILGAARTQDEVPGWMIPQIYFDYLRSGDPHPLSGVLYHNAMDILSLAGLFSHTVSLLANPIELDVPDGVDLVSIARLMEDLGYPDTAITLYKRGLEKGLAEPFFWDSLNRLALLHRKRLEWEAAIELWQKAAQHKQIEAHVELAKYFEHIARSPRDALTWTDMAIEIVSQPGYPRYLQRHLLPGLEHRRGRLLGKISKNGTDQVEENDAQN